MMRLLLLHESSAGPLQALHSTCMTNASSKVCLYAFLMLGREWLICRK